MNNESLFVELKSGDHKYQVYPLTGRKACHLDRKVMDIVYNLRSGINSGKSIGMFITHVFSEMDDEQFDELVRLSLHNVVRLATKEHEQNERVTLDNVYDMFRGALEDLYAFLIDLWKVYDLTPFAKAKVVNTGDSTKTT